MHILELMLTFPASRAIMAAKRALYSGPSLLPAPASGIGQDAPTKCLFYRRR